MHKTENQCLAILTIKKELTEYGFYAIMILEQRNEYAIIRLFRLCARLNGASTQAEFLNF